MSTLSELLLKAAGESPSPPTNNATTPAASRALSRPRNEEMGQCPQCGYKAPLDDFDNGSDDDDSDDSEGYRTDPETGATSGDDAANVQDLAKNLLKAANISAQKDQPLHLDRKAKKLTAEEAREFAAQLIAKAMKDAPRSI